MLSMPRGYDGYAEMDRYRQWHSSLHYFDDRTNPMHFSYAEGRSMRATPTGRPDRLLQDPTDQESPNNTNGNSTRRRIAVACSRCRKRKIKCSGDTGNGLGCQNCRSAGVDSCNFYRVGSLEVGMNQQPTNVSSNYLAPGNNDRLQYLNAQQSYHYTQHQQPLSIVTRGLPVSPYYPAETPYDNDSHPENYMLSPVTPIAPHDPYAGYALHDGSRSWSTQADRFMSYYTRYGEQDPTTYPYDSGHQHRRPTTVDGSGNTFSTSALQSSLPGPGTRVLPPPTARTRAPLQASAYDMTQMRATSSIGVANNVPLPTYSKSTQSWAADQTSSNGRHDSIASSRSSDITALTPLKPAVASSTSSDHSSLVLLSSSGPDPDLSSSTATTNDTVTADMTPSAHDALGMTHSQHSMYSLPTSSASETRLAHGGPASNLYTFSIARRQQTHDELSTNEDRHVGGASYVPLSYVTEASNPVVTTSALRHSTGAENRVHSLPHRTSMPLIGQDS